MSTRGDRTPPTGLGFQPVKIDYAGAAVEGASSGSLMVRMASYARKATPDRPYGLVNDCIATKLGTAIGVDVPPHGLVKLGQEWGFLTLGFGESGRRPPPADLQALATERAWAATGIVVLDQWLLNGDRHDENVAYIPTLGIAAFDHEEALIGANPPRSPEKNLEAGLNTVLRSHPLAALLTTSQYLEAWIRRVGSVMPEEISHTVWACVHADLISTELADALCRFILFRQGRLRQYIETAHGDASCKDFKRVDQWVLPSEEVRDDS